MAKSKTASYVCEGCSEWFTEADYAKSKRCPDCEGRLIKTCSNCAKPWSGCTCS